jgi:hypothetical protein
MAEQITHGLESCLAAAQGVLSEKFRQEAIDIYKQFYESSEAALRNPEDRIKFAQDKAIDFIEGRENHKMRVQLQTALKKIELRNKLHASEDPFETLKSIMTPVPETTVGKNLYLQENVVFSRIIAPLNNLILEMEQTALGRTGTDFTRKIIPSQKRKQDLIDNVLDEVFEPGSTKNKEAAEFAKAWKEATDYAFIVFNQHGGNIQYNNKWRMPQSHNIGKIRKVPKAQWVEDTGKLMDKEAMISKRTGSQMTDDELNTVLGEVYDSITSEGRNKLDKSIYASNYTAGSAVYLRHQEERILQFKNASSFKQYQKLYGEPQVYDSMINYMRGMAKDIAKMEVLGPNADSTVSFLQNEILDLARNNDYSKLKSKYTGRKKYTDPDKTAQRTAEFFGDMYRVYNGVQEGGGELLRNYRSLLMSTSLGFTSLLAAPTDAGTVARMFKMNNIPEVKAVAGYIENLLNITNGAARKKEAAELGLINEAVLGQTASTLNRYLAEDTATPLFRFIGDSSLRLTGLTAVTERGRQFAGRSLMEKWAKLADTPWDKLADGDRVALSRYEITDDMWNKMRQAKQGSRQFGDVEFKYMSPRDIEKISGLESGEAQEIADAYMRMILGETERGVPTVSLLERTQLIGTTKPGTIPGEITRSFGMFKSWPFAFKHLHLDRQLSEAKTPLQKMRAVADVAIMMTILGGVGVQLMNVARGVKPQSMDPTTEEGRIFWATAFTRGGGLGPLVDVAIGLGDYRQGLSGYVAGPVIGAIDSIGYALFGSAKDFAEGDEDAESKFRTRTLKTLIRHTPYQNNWMINTAMKRMVWERLLLWSDPDYQSQINRTLSRDYKEGKEYWWQPGETNPNSTPFE